MGEALSNMALQRSPLNAKALGGSMTTLSEAKNELEHLKSAVSTPDGALVNLFLKRLEAWKEDDSPGRRAGQ